MKQRRKACSLSILLIEDNSGDAHLITEMLEGSQNDIIKLIWRKSLSQAIDVLGTDHIDIVLLDLSLPDSYGLESFIRLNNHVPKIPIIVLSGLNDESIALKAVRSGAQDYFVKGKVDGERLISSIRYAIQRKMTEEQLKKAYDDVKKIQDQLIESEKMAGIGQLASGVAHEINNPLQAIIINLDFLKGYLLKDLSDVFVELHEVLRDSSLSDKKKVETLDALLYVVKDKMRIGSEQDNLIGVVNRTLQGAERIRDIVSGLMNFYRSEKEEAISLNINEELEKSLFLVSHLISGKCQIIKDFHTLPQLVANPGHLSQIFINIIQNSIKAIRDEGIISLKTSFHDPFIEITVSDNGKGIPKGLLRRIYEPFYTTREVGQGIGLGLSIAYGLVRKYEGTINVTSEEGEGTIFTIQLPVTRKNEDL